MSRRSSRYTSAREISRPIWTSGSSRSSRRRTRLNGETLPTGRRLQSRSMSRVAAVDLGTNSTRLLVADVDGGRISDVARETRITRLGEGVDERRRLLPGPIARVRNVLTDFRRTADSLGVERILAIATSAVRDAENGEPFLGEIEWSYGCTTRLLSGHDEALMMFRGVTS